MSQTFTTFDSFLEHVNDPDVGYINVKDFTPSSQELQTCMFAVHASNYLWPDAILSDLIDEYLD